MGIRPAREGDLPRLREIERAAGEAFATIGMQAVADDDPPTVEELDRYRRAGRAWVQIDGAEAPVAYLIADVVDGAAHVEQVSVDPIAAGRGLGRELIEHLAGWAIERGLRRMTLTTFTEVPWNGPYYRHLGFRSLDDTELGPELARVRAEEIERGLDRWPRVAMARDLDPA